MTDGRIELRNFGVFEVKKRAARNARNPRTGDKVLVPEKYVVTFKPGKEMEARVGAMDQPSELQASVEFADETLSGTAPQASPVDPPSNGI